MGIYVWGTGCGASELLEQGLELERICGFVDSYPCADTFLGKPVLLPRLWKMLFVFQPAVVGRPHEIILPPLSERMR